MNQTLNATLQTTLSELEQELLAWNLGELERLARRAREPWLPRAERAALEQETLAARARLRTLMGAQDNT